MRNFLVFLMLAPSSLFAWGPQGHRIVADVAQHRLSPAARFRIKELLGNDDLAAVSVWADDIKSERPETFGWHFVDIPMNSDGFSEARDCYRPEEKHPYTQQDHHNCVVDRISMFEQVLANRNAPRQEQVEALKFLVHFVGDVHQPLHAIGEARGGNDIHVVEFGSSQCGKYACNLHFAWDIGLIEHTALSEEQYVARIEKLILHENLRRNSGGPPEQWANESFHLAKKAWLNEGGSVDEAYYRNEIAVLDERLAVAGIRLASLLNQTSQNGTGSNSGNGRFNNSVPHPSRPEHKAVNAAENNQ